ncbi:MULTISPECIES: hypothetical protein [Lachnospiraceae]|jgi:hypothetical protein|uniref:DUF5640 domain-containing protein n=1 Tax=Faecalicatena acetigenes TaxID=2981790 RepID=A0ABT2TBI0_9FIRM|nr:MULTISPECIES: hypothetical protein [Lachnospiraceae]MCU6747632.1 hypothetical protein [Faecalicatena acetigenes]
MKKRCVVDTVIENPYNETEEKKGRWQMIFGNDEGKRNSIWKTVMSVSTVLIIIIAAFFIIKLFTANPLEGKWYCADSDLTMSVGGDKTIEFSWKDEEEQSVKMHAEYQIDKEEKVLTLYEKESADDGAGGAKAKDVSAVLDTSYDYSIEQETLTLTDREYGEQMIFERK